MNANVQAVVEACSRGSEEDWLNFGQVLEKLAGVGVEGYYADFRRSAKTSQASCSTSPCPACGWSAA